ncbi:MAG: FMN-binding glutamate synthase family protein [Planctomycetota bacterium]|nr:FMN-binding glutamate synthase family protein [Planctomycetota bacterium]MEE3229411.1 FMN-binding glutamate synthase family protein [Planctomycetota bacterium]
MWSIVALSVVLLLLVVGVYDLLQRNHAILRNFPIVGHLRYLLEMVGPELRQYIVTNDNEERPFSRDQRRWVYASSKKQNNYFGFGTDDDLERAPNHLIIKHNAFPVSEEKSEDGLADNLYALPGAKILGGARNRKKAFRPASIINISGMSFGSLSAAAIEALNCGSEICGCLHNTGEGGVAPYHLKGGELIWQIGTGYFGCRAPDGGFDKERFLETCSLGPVRAIEVKLSQGAKPGLGGLLPAAKVSKEIAAIRGIPLGEDCHSPASHTAFSDADSLLDFVEELAADSGLPVGIKSAVGEISFWRDLAHLMATTNRGVDFIAVDGGEGGTGAAPLAFSDHVSMPFKIGMSRVYRQFAERNLHQEVVFIGSGKLGFPDSAMLAFSLGCDLINVGREAMLAVGCIQAQRCHTGHCPTGVATQSKWLMRGLDPTAKAHRLANYVVALRKEILQLSRACGVRHPALVVPEHFELLDDGFGSRTVREVFGYEEDWSLPAAGDQDEINGIMKG